MEERILISGCLWVQNVYRIIIVTSIPFWVLIGYQAGNILGRDAFPIVWMAMFLPISVLILRRNFRQANPVTFDEKNIYWGKPGKERSVEFSKIESLTVTHPRGGHLGKLKFKDESGKIKSIWWDLRPDERYPFPHYRMLEECIGKRKLDFKIDGIHRGNRIFYFRDM